MQLSPISLAITRLGGVRFSPAALFPSGTTGVWYDPSDSTTIFEDTAGTIPCRTPGATVDAISVGLMLDKSQGLALGSEAVTNGGPFTATTGWTGTNATLSVVSSNLRVTNTIADGGNATFSAAAPTIGKWYKVQFTVVARTVSYPSRVFFGGNTITGLNAGTYTYYLYATTIAAFALDNGTTGVSSEFADYANISVKELAGNHAISYNASTARPVLSARVNLLTYSEQFDNAAWNKGSLNTTGTPAWTNVAVAPDGTTTADKLIPTVTNSGYAQQVASVTAGVKYTISLYVKAAEMTSVEVGIGNAFGDTSMVVNLSTGQVTTPPSGADNFFSTDAGNGWWRVGFTKNSGNSGSGGFYCFPRGTANSSDGVLVWGADLRPANIGTSVPAYQRIADQYTYDSSGFPRYLVFNGTASGMYTPANLNLGTDKATVFAGVRKISDAAAGIAVENGSGLQDGTFLLAAPLNAATANYGVFVNKTGALNQRSYSTFAAPITNVLSLALSTVASNSAQAISFRANGSVVTGTDLGSAVSTGNFGTYPLYIGSRNNGSLWFNGYLYSLIVVGAASTAAQISSTESWINVKEGTVY